VIRHEDHIHDRVLSSDRQLAIVLQAEDFLARRPTVAPRHTMITLRVEEECTQNHGNADCKRNANLDPGRCHAKPCEHRKVSLCEWQKDHATTDGLVTDAQQWRDLVVTPSQNLAFSDCGGWVRLCQRSGGTDRRDRVTHGEIGDNESMVKPFPQIVAAIEEFAATAPDVRSVQKFSVKLIAQSLPYYNWVGFYMLEPQDPNVLVLGPFHGAPTEHVRIPVSEGICGAAVGQGETVIVDDVAADPRYLACSIETRSEIVVPIRANGRIAGEIDVDSHDLNAFSDGDRSFLENCAGIIGKLIETK
jgi:L-methionine (R)-S-oxide reductase